MTRSVSRLGRQAARWALLFGLTATLALAQNSSFGQAAQGIANEMILIAKWVGIILCIICGIGLMVGGPGTVAKVPGPERRKPIFSRFRFSFGPFHQQPFFRMWATARC